MPAIVKSRFYRTFDLARPAFIIASHKDSVFVQSCDLCGYKASVDTSN